MLVKDEADVIETTVRHLATQVDEIIVADNLSTDATGEILARLAADGDLPLTVMVDDEPGYYQSRKTTKLAQIAWELGHEWVVPCDADEIWYSVFGRLADVLAMHVAYDVVTAEMYDHVPTVLDDAGELDPVRRIRWRRDRRGALPKVACRLGPDLTVEMGNHAANYQGHAGATREWGVTIRHFPYRSPEQFVRKAVNGAAAYAASDVPAEFGGHWRQYGQLVEEHGERAAHDWFHHWFYSDAPPLSPAGDRATADPYRLREDPAPIGGFPTPAG
jgi:glycosyltransferase involved in cell wall biosynthesis